MRKEDEGLRSHYLTVQTNINDAPAPDEIVIALGATSGERITASAAIPTCRNWRRGAVEMSTPRRQSSRGAPLVLLRSVGLDHTRFGMMAPLLEARF